jgi:thiol-disulfide isomerase/thioredoxin
MLSVAIPISHAEETGKGQLQSLKIHNSPIKLPIIEFTDIEGKKITNTTLIGKVSVINLWATWCSPCIKELPSINNLAKILGSENIKIYAVSQDRAGSKVVPPYFERLKLNYLTIYLDNKGSLMSDFNTPVLPTTVIVNSKGMEVGRLVGTINWDSQEVVSFLRALAIQK